MHTGSRRSRLSRLAPWIVGILTTAVMWLILAPLLIVQTFPAQVPPRT